jgi:hypothetical protein
LNNVLQNCFFEGLRFIKPSAAINNGSPFVALSNCFSTYGLLTKILPFSEDLFDWLDYWSVFTLMLGFANFEGVRKMFFLLTKS